MEHIQIAFSYVTVQRVPYIFHCSTFISCDYLLTYKNVPSECLMHPYFSSDEEIFDTEGKRLFVYFCGGERCSIKSASSLFVYSEKFMFESKRKFGSCLLRNVSHKFLPVSPTIHYKFIRYQPSLVRSFHLFA